MPSLAQTAGLIRSILMYYGVPFRARRLLRFYASFIRPGDLCFDIGAHAGSRLRIWSRLGARIVAVEPQPLFLRFLQRWYGRRENITLLGCALGAAPGLGTLLISQRTPTVTSLSSEWISSVRRTLSFSSIRWDASIQVPLTTLDALIEQYGEPAFCKIDVEGYELEVLRGLNRPLACLSFEFIPAAVQIASGCIERLEEIAGYEYNLSIGESSSLYLKDWVRSADMAAWLRTLPSDGPSGDIYARWAGDH